ncbi:MAG: hypothetical protein QW303_01375 [Nitrososphaerota archaeon]
MSQKYVFHCKKCNLTFIAKDSDFPIVCVCGTEYSLEDAAGSKKKFTENAPLVKPTPAHIEKERTQRNGLPPNFRLNNSLFKKPATTESQISDYSDYKSSATTASNSTEEKAVPTKKVARRLTPRHPRPLDQIKVIIVASLYADLDNPHQLSLSLRAFRQQYPQCDLFVLTSDFSNVPVCYRDAAAVTILTSPHSVSDCFKTLNNWANTYKDSENYLLIVPPHYLPSKRTSLANALELLSRDDLIYAVHGCYIDNGSDYHTDVYKSAIFNNVLRLLPPSNGWFSTGEICHYKLCDVFFLPVLLDARIFNDFQFNTNYSHLEHALLEFSSHVRERSDWRVAFIPNMLFWKVVDSFNDLKPNKSFTDIPQELKEYFKIDSVEVWPYNHFPATNAIDYKIIEQELFEEAISYVLVCVTLTDKQIGTLIKLLTLFHFQNRGIYIYPNIIDVRSSHMKIFQYIKPLLIFEQNPKLDDLANYWPWEKLGFDAARLNHWVSSIDPSRK